MAALSKISLFETRPCFVITDIYGLEDDSTPEFASKYIINNTNQVHILDFHTWVYEQTNGNTTVRALVEDEAGVLHMVGYERITQFLDKPGSENAFRWFSEQLYEKERAERDEKDSQS